MCTLLPPYRKGGCLYSDTGDRRTSKPSRGARADSPECKPQPPPDEGDGCGHELDYWLKESTLHPPPPLIPPKPPLTLAGLPPMCKTIVQAP